MPDSEIDAVVEEAEAAALAVRRWQRVQAAMRRDGDLPATRLPVLLGITLLAMTIMVIVVLLVPSGR